MHEIHEIQNLLHSDQNSEIHVDKKLALFYRLYNVVRPVKFDFNLKSYHTDHQFKILCQGKHNFYTQAVVI